MNEFGVDLDGFETWANQVRLLKGTYDLNEQEMKVIIGSRLKGESTSMISFKIRAFKYGNEATH